MSERNEALLAGAVAGYVVYTQIPVNAIVSIGSGFAFEFSIFKTLLPQARRIGVDANDGFEPHVDGEFLQAMVSTSKMPFWFRKARSEASTAYRLPPFGKYKQIETPWMTLDQVWKQFGLSGSKCVLWLDAEGSELDIIASGPKAIDDCHFVCIEVTTNEPTRPSPNRVNRVMKSLRFMRVKVFDQDTVEHHLYERRPTSRRPRGWWRNGTRT